MSGKALADNINVLVTYPVLLPQLLSVSVCLFALLRLTCDFLSLTICKQASVCVCLFAHSLTCVCVCVTQLGILVCEIKCAKQMKRYSNKNCFPPLRLPLSASLPLSLSLPYCLSVCLSGCPSVSQSVRFCVCVCMRGTKTNYTVKCVCLTSNLIKVMLLFRPSTVRAIHNLPQTHTLAHTL